LGPTEGAARTTFVVVGAGYTGTQVAAQGVLCTDVLHARHRRLGDGRPRWLLLDLAERILPELNPRPSGVADAVLRARGEMHHPACRFVTHSDPESGSARARVAVGLVLHRPTRR
jgi:NADH dehydrogenase FAD-containing subunit